MNKGKIFKSLLFGGLSAGVIAGSVGAIVACSTSSTQATVTKLMAQSANGEAWDGYTFKDFMKGALQTPEGQTSLITSQAQLLIHEWYKNSTLNDSDGQANYRSAQSSAQNAVNSAIQSAKDTYRTDWENNYQRNTLDKNGGTSDTYIKYSAADSLKTTFVNAMFSDLKFGLLQQPSKDEFKKYGPRVSLAIDKVIPATVTAADITSDTLKYGFAPTGEYNTDDASSSNSLYSYAGNTFKFDQLKAGFQSYVFDTWFKNERPVVVKTALFKYAAPTAGVNAIYPAIKYGTTVAAGLNFPMFADESVNSKDKGAADSYQNFMNYVKNTPANDEHVVIPLLATMDSSTTIIGTLKDLFTSFGTVWAASVLGVDGTALKAPSFAEPTQDNRHALMDNFINLSGIVLTGKETNNELIAKALEKDKTLTTHFKSSNGWVMAPDEFGIHISTMDRFVSDADKAYDWSEKGIKEAQQIFLFNLLRGSTGSGRTINENETLTYDLLTTLKTYLTNNFDNLVTGFAATSDSNTTPLWLYKDAQTRIKTFADIKKAFYLAGGLVKEDNTGKNEIVSQIDSLANYDNTLLKALQKFSWITSFDHVMRTKISTIAQTANNNAFTGGITAYKNGMLASFGAPDSKSLYEINSNGQYSNLISKAPELINENVTVDLASVAAYVDTTTPGYPSSNSELLIANNAVIDYAMFQLRKNGEYANIVKYLYTKNKMDQAITDKKVDLYNDQKGKMPVDNAAFETATDKLNQLADFLTNATKSEFGVATTNYNAVFNNFVDYAKINAKDVEQANDKSVISVVDRKNQTLKTTIAYLLQPAVDSANKAIIVNDAPINNYQQILLSNLMGLQISTRFTEVWGTADVPPNGNANGMYGFSTKAGAGTAATTFFSYSGNIDGAYGSTSNVVYSPDNTLAGLNSIGGSAGDVPAKVSSILFAQNGLLATLAANYGTIGLFTPFVSRSKVNDFIAQMIKSYETGGHSLLDAFIQQLRTSLGLLLSDTAQSSLTTQQMADINAGLTDALSQYEAAAKQTALVKVMDNLDAAAGASKDGIKYNNKPISLYSGTVTAATVIKSIQTTDFLGDGNISYKVTMANAQSLLSYDTIMKDYSTAAIAVQLQKSITDSYQFIKHVIAQVTNTTTQSAAIRYFLPNHGKYTGELTTNEKDATKPEGTETGTVHDRSIYTGLGSSDYVRGYGDI